MNRKHKGILAAVACAAVLSLAQTAPGMAQVAPNLGTAGGFAVLGTNAIPTTGTVTCTTSTIDGNVGTTGNSITNTGCTINGNIVAPVSAQVVTDFNDARDELFDDNPCGPDPIPIVDTILPPGVYCSDAETTIPSTATITLQGGPSDVWVFKVGTAAVGALTNNGTVVMDGGDACNVYWWTQAGTTMTDALFVGNVLSGAAITMTDTGWEGRALATTDVTLTEATFTGCLQTQEPPPPGAQPSVLEIPTLGPAAMAGLFALLAGFGLLALRRLSI